MARKHTEIVPNIPNPFINTLEIPAKWALNVRKGAFETSAVDLGEHVKIYFPLMDYLESSTSSGRTLLVYIMRRLRGKTDVIELSPDKTGLGKSSFYNAVEELTNALIIRSRREVRLNTYWLNPAMLFRGNRLEKYPERAVYRNADPLELVKNRVKDFHLSEEEHALHED